jgi:hypothetical protein
MLGVLKVIFRRDRIAGRLRVARKLEIFFRNVRWRTANLQIGSVRFEHPRHRILTLAVVIVIIVIVVVTSAHALVLTVSHDLPVATLRYDGGAALLHQACRFHPTFGSTKGFRSIKVLRPSPSASRFFTPTTRQGGVLG